MLKDMWNCRYDWYDASLQVPFPRQIWYPVRALTACSQIAMTAVCQSVIVRPEGLVRGQSLHGQGCKDQKKWDMHVEGHVEL